DDDAEIASESLRHVGDAGRGQRTDQEDVDAGGDEARFERRFEHVAGDARVLADQHASAARGQNACGCAREPQCEIDRHRRLAAAAATPISPKEPAHLPPPVMTPPTICTASRAPATSWVRTMRAPALTA